MRRLVNFLRGWTQLTVTGVFPERMLNLCGQRRVPFWGLEWVDEDTFRFRVPNRWVSALPPLAERARCTVCQDRQAGLPAFLARFRRRYAFLVGLGISMLLVCVLSNFILWVDVSGCETVSQARVLTELRRLGVYPGAFGPSINGNAVGQQALIELQELSWMSVNIRGSRAEVIVREATPPPEMADEDSWVDVVAETDGVIRRLETLTGQARVQVGEAVLEGEVLISGQVVLQPPAGSEMEPESYTVHAAGRVWADTRRTVSAVIPLTAQVKEYTGEEKRLFSLNLLGRRINFYQNSGISWPQYDKINETRVLTLPGGRALPISLTTQVCRAYDTVQAQVDPEAARELLEEQLLARVTELLGEDGEVLDTTVTAREENGLLTVTLTAACREEIGTERPGQPPAE